MSNLEISDRLYDRSCIILNEACYIYNKIYFSKFLFNATIQSKVSQPVEIILTISNKIFCGLFQNVNVSFIVTEMNFHDFFFSNICTIRLKSLTFFSKSLKPERPCLAEALDRPVPVSDRPRLLTTSLNLVGLKTNLRSGLALKTYTDPFRKQTQKRKIRNKELPL